MRKFFLLRCLLAVCITAVIFAIASPILAQSPYSIRINAVETVEDTDALLLNTYFTLFDSVTGNVVTNSRINTAEITFIDSQEKFAATVLQPDTPFYIALVLDTSGSMAGASAALQAAAIEAIKSPPEGARFAIMKFNDRDKFEVVQTFLDITNTDPLERAIKQVVPIPNAGTCLYDAAYSAIAELERTPKGRRAVILFTDGKDEILGGDPCSTHSYEDVIQYATRGGINIPVHTIGLASKANAINSEELKNMAVTTGGFSVVGTQENLNELFKKIMDVLKSQWLAQARLYPVKGQHNVLLRLKLDDGSILSESLTFTSTRDYVVPPDPVSLAINGITPDPARGGYLVDIGITSPQLIQKLVIQVWDNKTGLTVHEIQQTGLSEQLSIHIPSEALTKGNDYEVRLFPYDLDNKEILNPDGETPFLVGEFTENTITSVGINVITLEEHVLVAQLQTQNAQEIGEFKAWLVNEDTNIQVPGSTFSTKTLEANSSLHLPLDNIQSGKYTLVVQIADRNGNVSAEDQYEGINYIAPTPPGLIERAINGMMKKPLILGAVVLILVVMMGGLLLIVIRSRSLTATPMLQSSLPTVHMRGPKELPINQTQMITKKDLASITPPTYKPAPISQGISTDPGRSKEASTPTLQENATMITPVVPTRPAIPAFPAAAIRLVESADSSLNGRVYPVQRFPFTIGRSGCDVNIENDRSISHIHARIGYDERQKVFTITDVSRNGVLLAGRKIERDVPTPLTPGGVLSLGPNTTAVFEMNHHQ